MAPAVCVTGNLQLNNMLSNLSGLGVHASAHRGGVCLGANASTSSVFLCVTYRVCILHVCVGV